MSKAKKSITKNGEQVKSKSEMTVANCLRQLGLEYEYEKPVDVWARGKAYTLLPDFYLPQFDIYIEFWGLASQEEYRKKMAWKKKMYRRRNIIVIHLYPHHLKLKGKLNRLIMKKIKHQVKKG